MFNSTTTVIVLTKNNQDIIERCLESVKWADEIIVIDDLSRDKTVELAKKYTDKIFQRKLDSFDKQKNFAIEKSSSDWTLSLDSDEIVSENLANEIKEKIENAKIDAFYIPFKNYIGKRWIRGAGLYPDYHLRLFKKGKNHFVGAIHEVLKVEGPADYLRSPIIHYTYKNISDYFKKVKLYSAREAEIYKSQNKKVSFKEYFGLPKLFFWLFLKKKGYKDGLFGIVNCYLLTYYKFLLYKKARKFEKIS